MESAELRELLTPEGVALLDSLPAYTSNTDVLKMVANLRKDGNSPSLVATVLTQAKLRGKAVTKFGDFAQRMLFTEAGLEQATRLPVAALHAGRYVRAGLTSVADLGCGIGADALAFAGAGLNVHAVDADEVTAAITTYNLAPFPEAIVSHGTAEETDLSDVESVYLDPARRTSGHTNTSRLASSEDYSPSLDFAFGLATKLPTGIKLGPGFDRDLIPEDCEAQWISVNGDVVEVGLWFGPLKREGITRAALVINNDGLHELTSAADSADAEVGELGKYLYEPDGAVIRARLIGDLARSIGAHMLDEHIAYMSSDVAVSTPFASTFEVVQEFALDVKVLAKELKARGIGTLEIKKRGVDIDPAEFRKRLSLSGKNSATLFLTRLGERRVALLAQRV
ncbi:MAG: SAM-dependent methyltransferase [Rhodoluna sp.]